ncbi:MAG TPA: LTA synthase family protein [Bacteroidia bacterium]|jgi:phosphoglycerol transferase MdoB-like AlkP superfamily enzyme|nr:LTA synthase family protein [Bacteroidia bacterium]
MKPYLKRLYFLLAGYLLALFVLTDARVLFFLLNKSRLVGVTTADFLAALFYGLRFDIITATIVNALFIFLVAMPVGFLQFKKFRATLKVIFVSTNLFALALNMVDMAYFPFTLRRSTAETFSFFFEKNDASTLLPLFLKDFWYLFVIFFLFLFLLNWLYKIIERKILAPFEKEESGFKTVLLKSLNFLFIIGLSILSIRGGTQLIPLGIIDAGTYVKPQCVPIVLNTPLCVVKSGVLYTLTEKNYMSDADAHKLIKPIKKYNYADADFKKMNVVVVILESFSKEFTKLGHRKSYTPFLDSLMDYSFVYTNAFANGKRSIEGIPAIVASLPSFDIDYISTVYSNDKVMSLASTLKTKGYSSSFFHGGTNGTMNFNGFCGTAGYDRYFGRNEYKNEKDYDGSWGIWDEPFLQRMAQELDKQPEPFLSTVFTLSSHHPFVVPDKYKSKFPEGKMPIQKCVAYTDYALQQFFNSIKKSKWFANTLFVFTADHTGPSEDAVYANSYGNFQVPLFFYMPDNSLKGSDDIVAQQIDIMPTTLAMLKYNQPFFAFGTNLKDSTQNNNRFAVNYFNGVYQYYNNIEMLQFNGEKLSGYFNYRLDSTLTYNMVKDISISDKKIKAFIQVYNNSVIANKISVK